MLVEVCVSDNCSSDATENVVKRADVGIPIKYFRNSENLGIPRNFLNVVDMAQGEFVWLVGDDDLLMPDSFKHLSILIQDHPNVDFFYVNAYHLTTEYVLSHGRPFDTHHLPSDMKRFSPRTVSSELRFMELINPAVSFDFLGGMFLSVFRRSKWMAFKDVLNDDAIHSSRTFSHFDNTFPHVRIFSSAFANSQAYFNATPFIVCLTGVREWAPMYPMVRSVRLVEALNHYRVSGLSLKHYFRCKNFALSNFIPDMVKILINPARSGFNLFPFWRVFMSNIFYPNALLSPILFVIQRYRLGQEKSSDK